MSLPLHFQRLSNSLLKSVCLTPARSLHALVFRSAGFGITPLGAPRRSAPSSSERWFDIGELMLRFLWKISIHSTLCVSPALVYEGIVLHDQDQRQKTENCMAMKYQKGTVYPSM